MIRTVTSRDDQDVRRLWSTWKDSGTIVVAPSLLRFEVTNVIHRLSKSAGASVDEVLRVLDLAFALGVQIQDERLLHRRAITLSREFDLSAAYDAHYLALAESLDCPFYTSDAKLHRATQSKLSWVHLV